MTRHELMNAAPGVVDLIREQGELRLQSQADFADAQDVRGAAIMTAAVALAAAAVTIACGAAAFKTMGATPVVGGFTAACGFTFAAVIAVFTMRSTGFHAVGWYPQDFGADLANQATADQLKADFVVALQSRLSENKTVLDKRGTGLDWASYSLIATPIVAFVAGNGGLMSVSFEGDVVVPVAKRLRLEGAGAIASYIGKPERWVYQCRERGWSCPVRKQEGIGLYAFPEELDAWLIDPSTLPSKAA